MLDTEIGFSGQGVLTTGAAVYMSTVAASGQAEATGAGSQSVADGVRFNAKQMTCENKIYYTPRLSSVETGLPDVSVALKNGDAFGAGGTDFRQVIDPISKVGRLAFIIEDIGSDTVQEKFGVDRIAVLFNSLNALELQDGEPLSPFTMDGLNPPLDEAGNKACDLSRRFRYRDHAVVERFHRVVQDLRTKGLEQLTQVA